MELIGFAIIIITSLVIGYLAKRGQTNSADSFFISDRSLGRWSTGISASATANTGFVVIGAVGMGYTIGISAALYSIAWLIGDIFFWFFLAKRINSKSHSNKAVTIMDLLNEKYSRRLMYLINGIIITMLIVYCSAQFSAAGKTLSSFYTLSITNGMLITLGLVLSYTLWGGFKSSIWTDFFQGIVMVLLTLFCLVWCFTSYGSISQFAQEVSNIDPNLLNLFHEKSGFTLIAFIAGFSFAGFGFSMSQPQVTTRIMAGKSEKVISDSKWIYIFFLHFTWIGMVFIGLYSRVLIPELIDSDPELALPNLAKKFYPLITGLVLGGMFSAIASSLDSMLVAISSSISVDILGLRNERISKLVYRLSIFVTGVVAIVLSIYVSESVFALSLLSATILTATVGAAIFIIVLNFESSSKSLFISIIFGLIVSLIWKFINLDQIISEALIGFLTTLIANKIVLVLDQMKKLAITCDEE